MGAQYRVNKGLVRFQAGNTTDLVSAYSTRLSGQIDLQARSFSFSLPLESFRGFSCSLLRLHFIPQDRLACQHPEAAFSGTLLDEQEFYQDGCYLIRAKGKLVIHGIEQQRIIRVQLVKTGGQFRFRAGFPIAFDDFRIRVPQIWLRNRVTEVFVDVTGELQTVPSSVSKR